jgi:hypothetical protein
MMGLRVIHDRDEGRAVIYNSTYETAFSPVFMGRDGLDAGEVAEMFIDWLGGKVRIEMDKFQHTSEIVRALESSFLNELPALLREKRERDDAGT